MFSFFKSSPKGIQVNDLSIEIEAKETILTAALRSGLNFPYSCKVGGCAECKCKLTRGKIKALTDASYLLSAEELQDGYILACQSIPKSSDVSIEVDLSRAASRQMRGKITAQKQITHDIRKLELTLEESPVFKAGQYAQLTLDSLPGVTRAYSFASKPDAESNTVSFFIRHVPGGEMSALINTQDLIGQSAEIESPKGDFYLRDSDKPMLMIAGGSGLAPIVSILEKAKEENCTRPVTIILGARTQADIYCLHEIAEIGHNWPNRFEYVQILSEEPEGSSWQGLRGFIGDHLERFSKQQSQGYLCGPPVMIDDCIERLSNMGISKDDIFADRFVTIITKAA